MGAMDEACVRLRSTQHERLPRLYGRGDSRYGHVPMPRIRQARAATAGPTTGRTAVQSRRGVLMRWRGDGSTARPWQHQWRQREAGQQGVGPAAHCGRPRPSQGRLGRPSTATWRAGHDHVRCAGWLRAQHQAAQGCVVHEF